MEAPKVILNRILVQYHVQDYATYKLFDPKTMGLNEIKALAHALEKHHQDWDDKAPLFRFVDAALSTDEVIVPRQPNFFL